MSDNIECVSRHLGRRRRYRVLAVILVFGTVMGYSVILLNVGVSPIWLVPVLTGVVTTALKLLRGMGSLPIGQPRKG